MSRKYHVDGEVVDRSEATVHVDDRGFRYGDAAFETCRAYGGDVFAWERHLDRLEETCETLGMADAVPDDLDARIDETLAANDLSEAYVRVSVSRGVQPGTLSPAETVDPTVVVYVKPLERGGVDGDPISVPSRRQSGRSTPVGSPTRRCRSARRRTTTSTGSSLGWNSGEPRPTRRSCATPTDSSLKGRRATVFSSTATP